MRKLQTITERTGLLRGSLRALPPSRGSGGPAGLFPPRPPPEALPGPGSAGGKENKP